MIDYARIDGILAGVFGSRRAMVTDERRRDELVEAVDDINPLMAPMGRAFKEMAHVFERETGIGSPKWFVLAMLARSDGLSQGEVSQCFDLDPSRLTRLGQALEGEGLIRRERDPEDNRVVRMYLTEAGREKLRDLPALRKEFHRRISDYLSDEDVSELRRMLGLVAEAMKN